MSPWRKRCQPRTPHHVQKNQGSCLELIVISYHLTRTLDHHWHWMMITWGEVWNESLAHRLALHHPFQLLNIEECLVNFISDLSYFSSPFVMTASMMIGCDRRAGKLDAGCCWCWGWCWRQWWWSGVRLVTAALPCGRGGAQVTRHSSTLHPLHCSLTTAPPSSSTLLKARIPTLSHSRDHYSTRNLADTQSSAPGRYFGSQSNQS